MLQMCLCLSEVGAGGGKFLFIFNFHYLHLISCMYFRCALGVVETFLLPITSHSSAILIFDPAEIFRTVWHGVYIHFQRKKSRQNVRHSLFTAPPMRVYKSRDMVVSFFSVYKCPWTFSSCKKRTISCNFSLVFYVVPVMHFFRWFLIFRLHSLCISFNIAWKIKISFFITKFCFLFASLAERSFFFALFFF